MKISRQNFKSTSDRIYLVSYDYYFSYVKDSYDSIQNISAYSVAQDLK